ELGIDYELKKYDRSPIMAPPEYKALHPLGSAPVIEDGDVKIAESGACVEYILQTHGNRKFGIQPGHKDYAEYLYWFRKLCKRHSAARFTTLGNLSLSRSGIGKGHESVKRCDARRKQILDFVDRRLSKVPWLAGEQFTAADIMNVCCLTTMRCFVQYSLGGYPNILAYLKRVAARGGYRRAMEKGDSNLDVDELIGAKPPPFYKHIRVALQARGRI
ncbi:hypothetical protein M434DRAFT_82628, partial [Hypoxylon sp. CO27-5]